MSDDLSGDMLAPSWPNLVKIVNRIYSKNKKILSLEFFLDLSVILRKILRIFVNTDLD